MYLLNFIEILFIFLKINEPLIINNHFSRKFASAIGTSQMCLESKSRLLPEVPITLHLVNVLLLLYLTAE